MALPLFVLYEGLLLLTSVGRGMYVRVGADVWIKQLLGTFGVYGMQALAVLILAAGIAVFWYERRRNVPLRARYFGWMIMESAAYAVVLALLVGGVVGFIFGLHVRPTLLAQVDRLPTGTLLILSIGAGLYEELFFRVLLVGGLYLGLRRMLQKPSWAYPIAAVVGAVIFSAVHYIGPLGDPFAPASFTFRFLFGLALNALFLWRGFAIAAWTHALYDVFVVTSLLG